MHYLLIIFLYVFVIYAPDVSNVSVWWWCCISLVLPNCVQWHDFDSLQMVTECIYTIEIGKLCE